MDSTENLRPLADSILFKPVQLGALQLNHRLVLSPLTRMRGSKESDGVWAPSEMNVEYYSQRGSKGGFMLTEATPISRLSAGYPGVPGIFTPHQIAGWKRVTDAVHSKGGFIYCQLWHVGRATVPGLLAGADAVSSTMVPIKGKALDGTEYSATPPRIMTIEEIKAVLKEYAGAAKRAIEAGFDGVEIHSANGYLLDQFLHDNVNERTDEYGGTIEGRTKLTLEVIKSVTDAIGAERTGIRLSPYNYYQDTKDSDPNTHWAYLCEKIVAMPNENRLSYVHMIEPRFDEVLSEEAKLESLTTGLATTKADGTDTSRLKSQFSLTPFRRILQKGGIKFLAAGGYNRENAVPALEADGADLIVMGKWFLANPDLPKRLAEGLPLNKYDRSTFYGADPPSKGYVDYPFYS